MTITPEDINMSTFNDSSGSNSRHRTMSMSVRRLQEMLNMHLDVTEKTEFVDVLNQYHISRDIPLFVRNLKRLLDTPAKKRIFKMIRKVIPKVDVEAFDRCCKYDGRKYDTMPAKRTKKAFERSRSPLPTDMSGKVFAKQRKQPKDKSGSAKHERSKDQMENESRESDSSRSTKKSKSMKSVKSVKSAANGQENEVKQILIQHSGDREQGFGFSIRGGLEFGLGIYVSMVDNGGMAEQQGLVPGDLLMEVNDVSFNKISHNEAAKIVRSASKLDMKICRVGRIPGSFVVHQMYQWVNPQGRAVSPPPELEQIGQLDSVGRKSGFMLLKGTDERKVHVTVREGQNLGLMIRGGREFGLGIYISGVDKFSMADKAGIKVGDQLLDVNGQSFLDITHAEAVRLLKTASHMIFTIKDVGKLPYARTKIDKTNWLRNNGRPRKHRGPGSQQSDSTLTGTSTKSSAFRKGIGSQLMLNSGVGTKWNIIEADAQHLLNNTEQGTLRYYLSEYQRGYITVDGLTMASFELLNTKAKMTMMSKIRNCVRGQDLDKFDMLLERREARQKQGFLPSSKSTYSLDGDHRGRDRRAQNPRQQGHRKRPMSAPASRAATMRERPTYRSRPTPEFELEPLRLAIEQIEDDPDFLSDIEVEDSWEPSSQLPRSQSNECLPSSNLRQTSLSSKRSLSVDTLTPVYIDTTSDLPPSPRPGSSTNISTQPRSKGVTRHRNNSYSHRQRSGSESSTLPRQYKSVEDVRVPNVSRLKSTPYPSRRNSEYDDVPSNLSSTSYIHLNDTYLESPRSPRANNVVYAEVHHPPMNMDGSPASDDSGVDVNGNTVLDHPTDRLHNGSFSLRQKRVTISSDNPVDIDDVLERKSTVRSLSHDLPRSNHSTLTNRSDRSNTSTLTNRRTPKSKRSSLLDSGFTVNSSPGPRSLIGNTQAPVQILINDGDGSIDTMSMDVPSPLPTLQNLHPNSSFVHHSYSQSLPNSYTAQRRAGTEYNMAAPSQGAPFLDPYTDDDVISDQTGMGDNSDLYVSPLDRVLDEEEDSYSDSEERRIEEAKRKYGDIPLDVIAIYKTKPTLGMAIEGGANTRQPLPRVINLQPGGSAYESGGLKVGHVILEVNQRPLVGLEHIVAAKVIAEAFKNKMYDNMELLVTESNTNLSHIVNN